MLDLSMLQAGKREAWRLVCPYSTMITVILRTRSRWHGDSFWFRWGTESSNQRLERATPTKRTNMLRRQMNRRVLFHAIGMSRMCIEERSEKTKGRNGTGNAVLNVHPTRMQRLFFMFIACITIPIYHWFLARFSNSWKAGYSYPEITVSLQSLLALRTLFHKSALHHGYFKKRGW